VAVKIPPDLGAQLRPQLPHFPNQPLRFHVQARRQQEDRAQARLALAALQQRNGRRVQARPLRQRFVGEPFLLPEAEKYMGKGFSRVQVMSLKLLT
jgi:hypothetical protein